MTAEQSEDRERQEERQKENMDGNKERSEDDKVRMKEWWPIGDDGIQDIEICVVLRVRWI